MQNSWTVLWDSVSAPLMAVVSPRDVSPAAEDFRIVACRDCLGTDPRDHISFFFIEESSILRLGCDTFFWLNFKLVCLTLFHPQGPISQFSLLFLSSCRKQVEDWSRLHFRFMTRVIWHWKLEWGTLFFWEGFAVKVLEEELQPTGDGLKLLEMVFFEKTICLKDGI